MDYRKTTLHRGNTTTWIIDPAKITRSGIENIASAASILLTTEATVADDEGEDEDGGGQDGGGTPAGGGMPGMGRMGGMM